MTSAPDYLPLFQAQQAQALRQRESTAEERIERLERLRAAVERWQDEVCEACFADFRKPAPEARLAELLPVRNELRNSLRHLRRWMKPVRVRPTLPMLGTRSEIRHEPRGVCLIIAPWNYPFQLSIGPLVSALAAGNTAIIKPSEMTPHVSALLGQLIRETFEPHEVAVVEGDHEVASALLELPFDHVFFTGSPEVGRLVMAAAARHLASVTLELGGKTPVIVDRSANVAQAARDIVWGKLANIGQTCIAPDYLFVHAAIEAPFLAAVREAVAKAYGATPEAVRTSPDYCRVVNDRHFQRLKALYEDAVARGARTLLGGDCDAAERYFAPTLLTGVPDEARMMQEEIFGPILPVRPFTELDRVIEHINARPKPLALYLFGKERQRIEAVLSRTSAGGVCVNHNLLHYGHDNLPFGGVNTSGIGKAHGRFGFEAFSNRKPVLVNRFSAMHMVYPPYTSRVRKLIDLALRRLG